MFITFEGIDFCGKSTQVELLHNYFIKNNKQVIVLREPGGTAISERIRDILLDRKNSKMSMETEFLLFSSSRAQLVRETIIPALKNNIIVISDRFYDSSTAYQGFGRGLNVEKIKVINSFAVDDLIPDLTFLIDIPVEVYLDRKAKKTRELDRIEISSNNFYHKVREGYLNLAQEENRIIVIDGTHSIEEIHRIIIDRITSLSIGVNNEN
jgi:dTMP kinase